MYVQCTCVYVHTWSYMHEMHMDCIYIRTRILNNRAQTKSINETRSPDVLANVPKCIIHICFFILQYFNIYCYYKPLGKIAFILI